MSALGVPARVVAMVALALAVVGAAVTAAGGFSWHEWIVVAALLVVAALNWRRARHSPKGPIHPPET